MTDPVEHGMTTTPECREPAVDVAPAETAAPTAVPGPDYAVLRWLVAATFIVILNETVMVNAIPRLMTELEITARAAQWLSTAFMLTMAVVIPVTGWFLQQVTTRRAFGIAMTTFCAGTLVCALAPVFPVLLAGRVVQAAGTAVMLPLLMTTLMTIVPEHDRGRVMGNVTLAMSVAPAMGPAVSGVILQVASWRWMFGLVLPVAVLIAVSALRTMRNVGEPEPGAVDWASVVLTAVGFGGFVYGLSRLGEHGQGLGAGWLIGGGAAAIALFVVRQLVLQRRGTPLLDLRTLTHPTFALALAVMAVAFMAMIGTMILLPLYLQDVRGLSALQTGLLVVPGGILMGLLGPSVGRVLDRQGSRLLVLPGAALVLLGLGGMSTVGVATPVWVVLASHVALMVGLAALFTPMFTLGLGALPEHLYSHGSSLLGAVQQVAAAIGTAVVITVMASRSDALEAAGHGLTDATAGGLRAAFLVGAGLAVVVLVLTAFLPNRNREV